MKIIIKIIEGAYFDETFIFTEPDCFLFGRTPDARISLPNDPYVSRQHFILEVAPPNCKITDLDSKNGTFVNEIRYGGRKPLADGFRLAPGGAKEAYLKDGDEIIVGDTRMQVSIEMDPVCRECGASISSEKIDKAAFDGNAFLCENCRNKSGDQEKILFKQIAETLSTPPKRPNKQTIHCVRCNKDITREAGIKAQEGQAEYICKACRRKEIDNPLEFINALLQELQEEPLFQGPSFSGYKIIKELGRGGMGRVYQAQNRNTKQMVAIKTMLPQVAINEENIRAFKREIEVTRQLEHRNVVQLFDFGNNRGVFFFVLEFVEGMDLEHFIKLHGGLIGLEDLAPIMIGALEGLAHAHQADLVAEIAGGKTKKFRGVVHRDLKPQNILLAQKGHNWIPKVADFGLSKSFESAGMTDMTQPGQIAGTPVYWPREQITHYRYLNPATDVFSMAAVFYEALTGSWVRDGFREMFEYCRERNKAPSISDYMKVIATNPPKPIQERDPNILTPVAEVLDRALRETEAPQDEIKMRSLLENLRYPDAAALKKDLIVALKKSSIAVPPDLEEAILFSTIPPKAEFEAALMVLDLVQSTELVCKVGDTVFSNVIETIHSTFKSHPSARSLLFLKCTGDGFLAVYESVPEALSLGLSFLNDNLFTDVSFRIALNYGLVKNGPSGDPLGKEVHRIFRIEGLKTDDRIKNAGAIDPPKANRILVTKRALDRLPDSKKNLFKYAGGYRLKGFDEPCDIWCAS